MFRSKIAAVAGFTLTLVACGSGGGKKQLAVHQEETRPAPAATTDGTSRGCYFVKSSKLAQSLAEEVGVASVPGDFCFGFNQAVNPRDCNELGGQVLASCPTKGEVVRCPTASGYVAYYAGWPAGCGD